MLNKNYNNQVVFFLHRWNLRIWKIGGPVASVQCFLKEDLPLVTISAFFRKIYKCPEKVDFMLSYFKIKGSTINIKNIFKKTFHANIYIKNIFRTASKNMLFILEGNFKPSSHIKIVLSIFWIAWLTKNH